MIHSIDFGCNNLRYWDSVDADMSGYTYENIYIEPIVKILTTSDRKLCKKIYRDLRKSIERSIYIDIRNIHSELVRTINGML